MVFKDPETVIKTNYAGGMAFDTHNTRTFIATVVSPGHKSDGEKFEISTYSKKDKNGFLTGESKVFYFYKKEEFESLEAVCKKLDLL